jgi:hypothetical protein
MRKNKQWLGTWPAKCDECKRDLSIMSCFYDARTISGHWGLFCPKCFATVTMGKCGTGYGQCYDSKTLVKLEG